MTATWGTYAAGSPATLHSIHTSRACALTEARGPLASPNGIAAGVRRLGDGPPATCPLCGRIEGRAIRGLRRRAGLSQHALAVRLGVTANTVARWERGELRPHPLRLPALRRVLRDAGAA